jgi:hypothetical protein
MPVAGEGARAACCSDFRVDQESGTPAGARALSHWRRNNTHWGAACTTAHTNPARFRVGGSPTESTQWNQ